MKETMKKKLIIILSSFLFLAGCGTESASDLSVESFQVKSLESDVITLDVRTPAEFAEGHISGAININVEDGNFESEIEKLDKNSTYAVYCRSGRRSAAAIETMKDAGFTSLFNMKGGTLDWTAAGLPLVRE